MKKYFWVCILALLLSCRGKQPLKSTSGISGTIAEKAMVVSARKEASEIGLNILKKGGNAFDAMIATEMALAVVYPYAGNLGGGGFMVYRLEDGQTGALDYREKAPLEAHREMYLDEEGNVIPGMSRKGAMAIGVPGTVAGIFAVHQKFGSLPMDSILAPVIELARNGYVISQKQENVLERHREDFLEINKDTILFARPFSRGDTLQNAALANTLKRLVKNGREEFYGGETGKMMVAGIQKNGGIMELEDLKQYQVRWRDPISFEYEDLRIISMSPPSSGGIVLGQIMNMVEPFSIEDFGHNSVKTIQLLTEAERRAYADRSYYLGDPDFVEIPVRRLLSEEYLSRRMRDFSFSKATPSSSVDHGYLPGHESLETTHYSIVDQFGNAVSVTTTLNGAYGSKLYIEDLGFFLNNEMDDFSAKPGVPNMFGLIGAEANSIAPEKRMLSSMTPTIVEKNGDLFMVLGSPGGSTIITTVLQTVLNVAEFGMGMQEAVNAPRFHHQWLPNEVRFEPTGFQEDVLRALQEKGYNINISNSRVIGKVDAILKLPNGNLEGGADPRGDDYAAGF